MSKYVPEVTNGGYTGKIVDENGNTVAIVNNYEQAVIIASAPELLEALNKIVVMTHQNTMSRGAIRGIARQAIAKAEGK